MDHIIDNTIKKVLVVGSGPIVIGQAAEFDYAGTQACHALKEEGVEVILLNSNPATIMTDKEMADKVYLEPITPEICEQIIRKERPDGFIASLGGQTGLNMALTLAKSGVLEKYEVRLLGTNLEAIKKAEDREQFKRLMNEIGEPICPSQTVTTLEDALEAVEIIGYPVIIRPAFTLGGTGGGMAKNHDELKRIVKKGLEASPIGQVLIEKSVAGYKEIEFEVIRDRNDNAISVCSMENFDPVGIHTGDSVVVAPALTLTRDELEILRSSALKIIKSLQIEGGCNVQFALHPTDKNYFIIEVNPRVSRSSALASKATGYPIARVTAKLALGYNLLEITNSLTKKTSAALEPTIDYVVCKMPRFPFDKFQSGNRRLGTQMKSTGEVMAIGRSFIEALNKALRGLEYDPELPSKSEWETILKRPDDRRIYVLIESLKAGYSVESLAQLTGISRPFIEEIEFAIKKLQSSKKEDLLELKELGFSDRDIAKQWGVLEHEVLKMREDKKITPAYKMVDTCAGQIQVSTPYFYSTYLGKDEKFSKNAESVVVIGSGPIRIGQGLEFDYATVHAIFAIKKLGYRAVIINNNPETVSTDFDISDALYFEPLTLEDVLPILRRENPIGVIVQFGGQTSIKLAEGISNAGYKILGTPVDSIDRAEDRERFEALLKDLNIKRPEGYAVRTKEEAFAAATKISYPVLVRPSYVLGGRAMEIVYNDRELEGYLNEAVRMSENHPVVVDRDVQGVEAEVDAISDGKAVLIPGIMEHIERAGVHSGDSIAVYPPISLSKKAQDKIVEYTQKIAMGLDTVGVLNIQFVVKGDEVFIIEVNPRASRTIPFMSKVTQIKMADLATQIMLGEKLTESGLRKHQGDIAVKAPVFSFAKLTDVDIVLGPEMKSTGEVLGRAHSFHQALYKALVASGLNVALEGTILFTIADKDKEEILPLAKGFFDLGYDILATTGTAAYLNVHGVKAKRVNKLFEGSPSIVDLLLKGDIDLIVNTISRGNTSRKEGFEIRRHAAEKGIPCLTSIDTAKALHEAVKQISLQATPLL
ncbi:MAG: carbamoyl-phosphate synthase large subunit [Firmicutes bacterium]|nr:carbamoyl-phosphate synthase large subunit [Bacillota bacterium]